MKNLAPYGFALGVTLIFLIMGMLMPSNAGSAELSNYVLLFFILAAWLDRRLGEK